MTHPLRSVLFVLSSVIISHLPAQQMNTFRASFDVGAFDITGGMIETPAKEYVIAGLNNSLGPYYGNAMKIDSAGTVLWAKRYTQGFATNFSDIKNVSTGGYIITGTTTSGGAILVRLDNNGNILWAQRYQLPNHPTLNASSEYGNAVIETSDGGFLVGGGVDYFWDGAAANTVDTASAFGFKTDASGNLLWSKVWVIPTANPDEHYINDVTESADGYFFVGQSSEGSGTLSSNGDYPSNALLIKTTTAGALTYIRRWGAGNTTSEGINCAIKLNTGANAGKILLGGFDDVHAPLITVDGTGGVPTMGAFNRRINGAAFPPRTLIIQDIMENADGNYSVIGMQIEPLSFAFYSAIYKLNSGSGALIFGRGYAPIGLSSILPEGGLCANQGYYISMTDQQAGGFNYNIMRTNNLGQLGAGPAGCNSVALSPGTAGYSPTLSTPVYSEYSLLTASSFTPVVSNITPTKIPDCSNIVCSKPPATVSGSPTTICAGQNSTLTATGGTSYLWSTGATTSSIVVSPTNTTAYTATVTASGCDSIPAPVTITVNSLPSASITGNTTICSGQSATLTGNGGGTYSWSTGSTATTITVSPTTSTNYTVTVTSAAGCTNAATASVTITSAPSASITGALTVCSGSTATLTGNGGGTYSWNTGATTTSISPVVTGTTTYSVIVSSGSCSDTAAATVSTNPIPTAGISGNNNICTGSSATLTASGGGTYSWSTGSTATSITVAPTTGTSYTVTVTNGSGCTDTATVTVNTAPPPTASVSGNSTICSGQSASLSASGGLTYSWTTGATTSSISVSPTASTTYSVIVSAGTCSDTAAVTVTVNPTPAANINTASTSICAGQSATLTATGGGTYSWNTGVTTNPILVTPTAAATYSVFVSNGTCADTASVSLTVSAPVTAGISSTASTICSGNSITITATGGTSYSWNTGATTNPIIVSPSAGTTYSVVASTGGCSDTAGVGITVNPSPTATVSATGTSLCAGQSATLTASGGGTYGWSTGSTAAAITVSPTTSTTYTVIVTAANGCTASAVSAITVTPVPNPAITASGSTICSGSAVTLTASGGTNYTWSPGGLMGASIVVTPTAGTTYTVTASNGNCSGTATATVNVNPSPSVASANVSINYGSSTTISASPAGGTPPYTYAWNTGEITSSIAVTPAVTTVYCVVVTDANGCADSACTTVTVEYKCPDIFYPNAFSPNNDGKNDYFRPKSPCLKSIHLIIFDRWGVKVFETIDFYSKGWDGMYNGEVGETAVYNYYFSYEEVDGGSGFKKGTISLIR